MNTEGNTAGIRDMDEIERVSGNIEREKMLAWAMSKYDSFPQRLSRWLKRLQGKPVISRKDYQKEWAKLALEIFPFKDSKW